MKAIEFLTEATFALGKDVDFLYDRFFKQTINDVLNRTWDGTFPEAEPTSTADLSSMQARKGHALNPMKIVTTRDNIYSPNTNTISVSLPTSAMQLVAKFDGNIADALKYLQLNQPRLAKQFIQEITPARIKGSIYHELSHWLDDTFHNRHITDKLNRATSQNSKSLMHGEKDVGLTRYEVNAQIHSIKQLKRNNLDMWDVMSFDDMVKSNASLMLIASKLDATDLKRWKKMLISRMAREGLVGEYMR